MATPPGQFITLQTFDALRDTFRDMFPQNSTLFTLACVPPNVTSEVPWLSLIVTVRSPTLDLCEKLSLNKDNISKAWASLSQNKQC